MHNMQNNPLFYADDADESTRLFFSQLICSGPNLMSQLDLSDKKLFNYAYGIITGPYIHSKCSS